MQQAVLVLERTLPLILVAAGMLGCLWLFFALKRDLRISENRHRKEIEEVSEAIRGLERRWEHDREQAEVAGSRALISNGMNFSKRSQALRMMRKGEDPERVAAALNLPAGEIQLLRKVSEIAAAGRSGAPTS